MLRTIANLTLAAVLLTGCATEQTDPGDVAVPEPRPDETGSDGLPALCARDRDDIVRDVFCRADGPEVRSLRDLQEQLDLVPEQAIYEDPESPLGVRKFVTMLGHSTSLSGHVVSPINPRLLIAGGRAIMAFQRGVQKVEVIAFQRGGGLNFYLIQFEQACNGTQSGCAPADLYTPQLERDWLRVHVEDDEDLKNSPSDCRQCHQRKMDRPRLLMRELNNPWTHFLQPEPYSETPLVVAGPQGFDLLKDYVRAKGDELYGGFAPPTLAPISPFFLESIVGSDQPVLFDAPGIETERFPYDIERNAYATEPRASPTWEASYQAFKRGEQLALPYLEPRPTDPDKHARLTAAYTSHRAGELDPRALPDLADIFPDDPVLRARIGLQTEPDAAPADALIQACGGCHNDVLDQSLSRARFNIDLSKLDAAAIARAIDRIERAPTDPGVMPPPEARQLEPRARARLLDFLRDDPLSKPALPELERAAELGMAGGANRRAFPRR